MPPRRLPSEVFWEPAGGKERQSKRVVTRFYSHFRAPAETQQVLTRLLFLLDSSQCNITSCRWSFPLVLSHCKQTHRSLTGSRLSFSFSARLGPVIWSVPEISGKLSHLNQTEWLVRAPWARYWQFSAVWCRISELCLFLSKINF